MSADGRFIAFDSEASNLIVGDTNFVRDIYVYDQATGAFSRVSKGVNGSQANGESWQASFSANGRYVSFHSSASNLVDGDTNETDDVFVYDRATDTTTRLSVDSAGVEGNNESVWPWISADGRCAAYVSLASNLVPNDTNSQYDIFVRDGDCTMVAIPLEQSFGPGPGIHAVNPTRRQADPVNSATGAFVNSVIDVILPSVGLPFEFRRSYTSLDNSQGRLGVGWTDSYAASLSVRFNGDVYLRGEDGQGVVFARLQDGSFLPPVGGRSTLQSVPGGFEVVRHDQVRYRFDDSGRLTELRDRNNRVQTLAYDANGRLTTLTDTAGRSISFTHDSNGLLTNVALPDGRFVSYGYTGGRLTSARDVRGGSTTYSYDAFGRLASITDANGHAIVSNTYGVDGRIIEQVDALGNSTTFAWDAFTETATMTDARGNAWRDVYQNGILRSRIDPLGNAVSYEYDADLNLVAITDARGKTWRMEHDSRGNLNKLTAPVPLGYETTWTYNERNDVLTLRNPRGYTTTFEYDGVGNLTRVTEPGNISTTIQRDQSGTGLITGVTDPRAKTTTFEYDTVGNITAITTPLGFKTTMGYDSGGRMTSRIEPRGNIAGANPNDYKWIYAYDEANNVLSRTDPIGGTTTWTYDGVGNLLTRTDPLNRRTEYSYDPANRLTSIEAPDGGITTNAYDVSGNLISRTDAKNHATTFEFDNANRLTTVTGPAGQRWTYAYDAAGNLTRVIDAIGNSTPSQGDGVTDYGYDEVNRLTSINYSDATPDVTFAYDPAGNRVEMVDGIGTESRTFDALNRLTSVARGSDTISYAYDAAGNLVRRTYPGAAVTDYTFDDDGRMLTVTSDGKTTTYSYDAAGNLTTKALPAANGHRETRSYDRAGRLTQVRNVKGLTILSFATYTLDGAGNPIAITSEEGSSTYVYDNMDRLLEACFSASCAGPNDPFIRYTYDLVGNRATEARPSGVTTYTYDVADRLLSAVGPNGTLTYAYDLNGNQTLAGSRTFTYDRANRLASTASGLTNTSYTYDGVGKRASTTTTVSGLPPSRNAYLWDPSSAVARLAIERDGAGSLVRRYVNGGDDVVTMVAGGSSYYFHYNGIGSVVNLTDATGAPQWTYAYEPFGKIRQETRNSLLAPENPRRFTGEHLDGGTGLYHLRARQYDPETGRFLRPDPLTGRRGVAQSSSYLYVDNRPTLFVDPTGLSGEPSLWDILEEAITNPIQSFQEGMTPAAGTNGWCVAGQVNVLFIHAQGSVCVVASSDGGYGVTIGGGSGGSSSPLSVSLGVENQVTSGSCINDLGGPGLNAGGSVGMPVGVGGGADGFVSIGADGQPVYGGSYGVGVTAGTPAEGHAGATYTWIPYQSGSSCGGGHSK